MNILIVNTSERTGGAAVAASRLAMALNSNGVKAKMLVRDKQTDRLWVIDLPKSWKLNFNFVWERFCIWVANKFSRKNLFAVSIANAGTDITILPDFQKADIIHLHWINQGMLSLKNIQKIVESGKPIVWTMHDVWTLTGICHHPWGCERFVLGCGLCQFLHSNKTNDLSHKTFKSKLFISESKINIVTVSSWLKKLAEKSPITNKLNISVIPNAIDINKFQLYNKNSARRELNLPFDKKIILMGAHKIDDPIKGFLLLKRAVNMLFEEKKDILLVIFGNIKDKKILDNSTFPIIHKGSIKDISVINQLYAAADVNVVPSYYETFGQTITEAMACGCPSVSFNNSGQTDIIDHKINGYLAKYKDIKDLSAGIKWVLYECDYVEISQKAREKIAYNFTEEVVAKRYIELYESLLNAQK